MIEMLFSRKTIESVYTPSFGSRSQWVTALFSRRQYADVY